jgi:hypothetical protein
MLVTFGASRASIPLRSTPITLPSERSITCESWNGAAATTPGVSRTLRSTSS